MDLEVFALRHQALELTELTESEIAPACLLRLSVAPQSCGRLLPPAFVLILCLGPQAVAPRACGSLPPPPGSISLTNSCAKMNQFSNAKYLLA